MYSISLLHSHNALNQLERQPRDISPDASFQDTIIEEIQPGETELIFLYTALDHSKLFRNFDCLLVGRNEVVEESQRHGKDSGTSTNC